MLQYTLESTVVQQETGRAAGIVFVPTKALMFSFGPDALSPSLLTENLGLLPGVQIPDVEGLKDVFFASLSGRYVPFDPGSFDRWRPQRQAAANSAEAIFADQLVTSDVVPVTGSIRGTSLAKLAAQGSAVTVSGAETITHDPLRGLAVLVIAEVGISVAQLLGAATSTACIALKFHLRKRLGIPPDWVRRRTAVNATSVGRL